MPAQKQAPEVPVFPSRTTTLAAIILSTGVGLGWLVYIFANSPGVPVHDELTHCYIARGAWHSAGDLLDFWGRVVNTVVYMPGAYFGLQGARIESIFLALVTGLLAVLLAKRLGAKYVLLVPVFLWFQPWFSDTSYTCTTEVPFSLVMVASMCFLASDSLVAAGFLAGLLPLIRHEGIALAALVALWCLWRRNWLAAAAAFAPLVLYNVACKMVLNSWPVAAYFVAKPTEHYGSGPFSHFVPALAAGAGLPVLILAANAAAPALGSAKRMFVLGLYLVYFAIHAVIYRFGLFASGGYGIFLTPLAPGIAVAAAFGFEFIVDGGRRVMESARFRPGGIRLAGWAFAIACVILVLIMGFETKPRPLDSEGQAMKAVAQWLEDNGLDRQSVYATHPWLREFLPTLANRPPYLKPLDQVEKGAVVVWDWHYGTSQYGLNPDEFKDVSRWVRLRAPRLVLPNGEDGVVVYRRQ